MRALSGLRCWFPLFTLLLPAAATAGTDPTAKEPAAIADTSYSIGYQVGGDFRRQEVSLQPEFLIQGVLDALDGAQPRMTESEMRRALAALQKTVEQEELRRAEQVVRANLEESSSFLAANAEREGVRSLPTGLQYVVLREGSGDRPGPQDTVRVRHRGRLADGTEFESSYEREEPSRFRMDAVLPGWQEGLLMMREGAHWRLFLPPELAFGSSGSLQVGPNQAVIYDIELVAVEPAP